MAPHTLAVRPAHVRFPDRCVECGGAATRTFALRGGPHALAVPVCIRDSELKTMKQMAWLVGCVLTGAAVVAALGFGSDALLDPSFGRRWGLPIALGIFAIGILPLWLGLRRGRAAFHRRFSSVYVAEGGHAKVVLAFRSPLLQRDVAVLSGVQSPAPPAPEPGYRSAARPAPAPYQNPGRMTPASSLLVAGGIVSVALGFIEYHSLGVSEARGETIHKVWLEIVAYQACGRSGVMALFVTAGVCAAAIGGRGLWRALRNPQST